MSNYEFGPPNPVGTYGDLCSICKMDLCMEGDDVCRSCAEELEAHVLVDVDPGDESRAA